MDEVGVRILSGAATAMQAGSQVCRASSETLAGLQAARNSDGAWEACVGHRQGLFLADDGDNDGDNDGDEQPAKKVQRQTERDETSEWARSARAALDGRRTGSKCTVGESTFQQETKKKTCFQRCQQQAIHVSVA